MRVIRSGFEKSVQKKNLLITVKIVQSRCGNISSKTSKMLHKRCLHFNGGNIKVSGSEEAIIMKLSENTVGKTPPHYLEGSK